MRQSDNRMEKNRKTHVTGQDFPKHSSSEGAPSDCSDEAWPSHSMVVEDEEHEVNLLATQNLRVEANLGAVQVADSGAAVVVAQGHVRGLGRPPSAHLGYQPVSAFAISGAVVVGLAVVVVLCSHSCC